MKKVTEYIIHIYTVHYSDFNVFQTDKNTDI